MVNILLTKPDLNEIMKFMCQLAALFNELLMLCNSIYCKVIFVTTIWTNK